MIVEGAATVGLEETDENQAHECRQQSGSPPGKIFELPAGVLVMTFFKPIIFVGDVGGLGEQPHQKIDESGDSQWHEDLEINEGILRHRTGGVPGEVELFDHLVWQFGG